MLRCLWAYGLPYLNPLSGSDCQFFFGVFDGAQLTVGSGKSDKYAFHIFKFHSSLREARYAVPAMCRCQYLNVVLVGGLKDHSPVVALN